MNCMYDFLTEAVQSIEQVVDKASKELVNSFSEIIGEGEYCKSKRGIEVRLCGFDELLFEISISKDGDMILGYNSLKDSISNRHAVDTFRFSELPLEDKVLFLIRAKTRFAELKPIKKGQPC